ncbi:MAG TPA: CoA transferase [Marinobacter adhaerens]|nr:CoA transferase [Rhodopirellula sp.]HAP52248.1 CoA transferase [Marinobacter adhaerens]HAS75168.1 CoA transferase [Marinobacter adhaerens]HAU17634.1 CoA transferase [Marinobacter adhaerens]HBI78488.1 CoA transferase [Marinobacter adhaerens]
MPLPLSGVRVLDLTRALSGPFCTMILADLGAEVIKVEPTPSGDMIRQWGPFDQGISAYYLSCNRNKKGIGVNFRRQEGLELIREMALKSDIVVENFKPGRMREMGLDYESIAEANPAVIYASITGFGSSGPAGDWPGFDQIAQGYSGLMSLTGMPDSGPTRVGVAVSDLTSGMWVAMAILAAWIEKLQTGEGQQVEASLLASLVGLLSVQGQRYLSLGEVPEPTGNTHPVIAPYGAFQASDGLMNLAPATQNMWLKLCELLELEDLIADERFTTNADRMSNRETLKSVIESRLALKTRKEWTEEMTKLGIPAGPINNLDDVFNDAQVKHCRMVETVEHPDLGPLMQLALPITMNGLRQGSVRTPPPNFGEHTLEVMKSYGIDPERLKMLAQNDVIYQPT